MDITAAQQELEKLWGLVQELQERLKKLEHALREAQGDGAVEAERQYRQAFPNMPVPTALFQMAGSLPLNAPEDDWKVIADALAAAHRAKAAGPD